MQLIIWDGEFLVSGSVGVGLLTIFHKRPVTVILLFGVVYSSGKEILDILSAC